MSFIVEWGGGGTRGGLLTRPLGFAIGVDSLRRVQFWLIPDIYIKRQLDSPLFTPTSALPGVSCLVFFFFSLSLACFASVSVETLGGYRQTPPRPRR